MESPSDPDALHDELLARCEVVLDFDAPRVEAFVSGLFPAFDDDDEIRAFIAHCGRTPGATSATVCRALALLCEGEVARMARAAFDAMASHAPAVVQDIGRSSISSAAKVTARFGSSVVFSCETPGDAAGHSILAELDDDKLVDLRLGGDASDFLGDGALDPGFDVVPLAVEEAVVMVVEAWHQGQRVVEPSVDLLANQRLVRSRFRSFDIAGLDDFVAGGIEIDRSRGMTQAEIHAADAAALSTLLAALGTVAAELHDPAWRDVVRAEIPSLGPREREALLWLEWADWLGVAIGLARNAPGEVRVDGEHFVDLVNRCPEVSSSIDRADREYARWAFEVAIDHLGDEGVVIDDHLPEEARARVAANFAAIWSAPADAGQ